MTATPLTLPRSSHCCPAAQPPRTLALTDGKYQECQPSLDPFVLHQVAATLGRVGAGKAGQRALTHGRVPRALTVLLGQPGLRWAGDVPRAACERQCLVRSHESHQTGSPKIWGMAARSEPQSPLLKKGGHGPGPHHARPQTGLCPSCRRRALWEPWVTASCPALLHLASWQLSSALSPLGQPGSNHSQVAVQQDTDYRAQRASPGHRSPLPPS